MARIGQLFGGRTRDVVDRDGDGVDDRLEADERGTGDTTERKVADGTEAPSGRRPGMFSRKIDRDHDGVDDRDERTLSTSTIPAVGVMDRDTDRDGIADRRESPTHRLAADGSTTTTMRRSIDRDAPPAPVDPAPGPEPEVVPAAPVRPARASMMATLGVMLGVAGVAVALTGLLAPWAIAVGALGLLFSFSGVIAGTRPNVAGRGLGTLGVLISGTAVVFGILAITGQVSWLSSDVDQVARLNEWLDARVSWMKDW